MAATVSAVQIVWSWWSLLEATRLVVIARIVEQRVTTPAEQVMVLSKEGSGM